MQEEANQVDYREVVPLQPYLPGIVGSNNQFIGINLADVIMTGYVHFHRTREAHAVQPNFCFWRLSRRAITMHQTDDVACAPFEEILMDRIVNIEEEPFDRGTRNVFALRMSSGDVYYIGDNFNAQDRAASLEWMQQIRFWCIQSLTNTSQYDINSFFEIDRNKVLGSGQFGVVYSGMDRATGEQVAIKAIDPYRAKTRHVMAEAKIPQDLKHPGILRIIYQNWSTEKIYIVSEKLHKDMLKYILEQPENRLCERMAKFFAYQMICALAHLESRSIAHCDMKPENILLVSSDPFPQIKLCDFGFSRVLRDGSLYTGGSRIGTPQYAPPEANTAFDLSVDTWSAGVVVYIFLTGVFPYNINGDVIRQVSDDDILFSPTKWRPDISYQARYLIREMLSLHTITRRDVMRRAKTHVWFTGNGSPATDIKTNLATYQFWSDLKVFEHRYNDEAILRGQAKRRVSHWVQELGIDDRMEQVRQNLELPPWNQVGCQP